jgi:hypothetical protein
MIIEDNNVPFAGSVRISEHPEMAELCHRLAALQVQFVRHTAYHLKVEDVSYYCPRGVVIIDPNEKQPGRGYNYFITVLRQRHLVP